MIAPPAPTAGPRRWPARRTTGCPGTRCCSVATTGPGVIETAAGDRGARDYLAARDVTLVECGDLATGRDVDSDRRIHRQATPQCPAD